jgi:tryptophan synthase beta chain
VARLEGIIPALESSHAVAWVLATASPSGSLSRPGASPPADASPASPRSQLDLICLSGRGDKDLAEALAALEALEA